MPPTNPYPLNPNPSAAAWLHNPALSLWLSVDPLSDKYPNLSPYVYCADNPVRLVDKDGRDIIDVDQKTGKTTITEQEGNDILRCGKKTVELSGNGVFRNAYEAGTKDGKGGTLLLGMSKSDARKTFNFMADNTNVEWGFMESSNASGQQSYLVGSAHNPDTESLVFGKAMESSAGSVLRYDHNHLRTDLESGDSWPSTPISKAKEGYVDTDAWNDLLLRNPNVSLGIRHRKETTIYIENGRITNAAPWLKHYIKSN